ncbi:MAG: carbohydrate ABC transporter permease [Micropruina sp.]|uniref:carbohydrate ABC transporter permease n=1 Tax=Micropruina sp. TaxID=2737536 RepID=UPI0039E60C91
MGRHVSGLTQLLGYGFLLVGAVASLLPFAWMVIAATHTTPDLFTSPPPVFLGDQLWTNLVRLQETTDFARVCLNSAIIAIVYTAFSSVVSAMCGYALAKYRFRGRGVVLGFILVTMMIPMQVLLVPLFQIMASVGWIDTFQAVILPFLANAFGIFLMRQAFESFPDTLIEAARIDGTGDIRIFFSIVLPVARPQLAALVIYTFMSQWNAFIWPLLMLNTEANYTIPVALNTMVGLSRVDYSGLMLGSLLTTLPMLIIFLVFQKQFVAGLLGGAVKG